MNASSTSTPQSGGLRCGLLLASLLLLGCGAKNVASTQGSDESPAPVQADSRVAELAGDWSGTAYISGYGTVSAAASLDKRGEGYYFVTLRGSHRQGAFRILRWDGSYLVVSAEGHSERVHATHKGDKLWVDQAMIGQVLLTRAAWWERKAKH